MARDTAPSSTALLAQAHERKVADALLLLDFAVSAGIKSAEGHLISADDVSIIESTAAKLGLLRQKGESASAADIAPADWTAFDLAYYDLAALLTPVTAETLRATAGKPAATRTWTDFLWGDSPAIQFTRKLWAAALGFAIAVILSNWYLEIVALEGSQEPYNWKRTLVELLTPWLYGGLGSCVYLLRSAHMYIYQRTFDVRRKPEYYNRILLGTMSGGAIILFVNQIAGDEGTVIQLGSAALGFLAGYSTDFLFSTIERVISAILPRVSTDTTQKEKAAGAKSIDVNRLTDNLLRAKNPADKEHIRKLTAHSIGMRAHKDK
ncbi:MAG TPA: hypothetical protein VEH02_09925 [Pseudolabrys sp.]|nr:hypothetical protein [Pseudolabrys sp.]